MGLNAGLRAVDRLPLRVLQPRLPPSPLPQQGARVFGALGPIGPSSPGLALGGLAVGEHRLSNKLLAWSGVLEWQEVSRGVPSRARGWGWGAGPVCGAGPRTRVVPGDPPPPPPEAQTLLGLHGEAEAGPALPGLREPGREPVSGGQGAGVGGWPGLP